MRSQISEGGDAVWDERRATTLQEGAGSGDGHTMDATHRRVGVERGSEGLGTSAGKVDGERKGAARGKQETCVRTIMRRSSVGGTGLSREVESNIQIGGSLSSSSSSSSRCRHREGAEDMITSCKHYYYCPL